MINENLHLEILKKSRSKVKTGDIFVLKPKGFDYYFGRTMSIDANCGFGQGAVLIYIYNIKSKDKNIIPVLNKNKLLLSPLFTNYLPWSKGYFETIGNRSLTVEDTFTQHCFKHPEKDIYYNEFGDKLDKEYLPVGFYGLSSYKSIDDKISKVLGIPLDNN